MRTVIEALVQKQQWQSCRDVAEATLAANPPDSEQAFLWLTLCRCHYKLKEFHKGAQAGVIAQFLAKRVGDWDLLGEAIFRTGICYYYARLYEQALQSFEEFFVYESRYQRAEEFCGEVLFALGAVHQGLRRYRLACQSYEKAVQWAELNGLENDAAYYRCNHIWMLIELGDIDGATALVGQLDAHVARVPADVTTSLHALHDRAHLHYLQGRYPGAFRQAGEAILQAEGQHPLITGQILLTLHYMAKKLQMIPEAIHLGLAAKGMAARTLSPNLEERVNESLKEIFSQAGTSAFAEALSQAGQLHTRRLRNHRSQRQVVGGAS